MVEISVEANIKANIKCLKCSNRVEKHYEPVHLPFNFHSKLIRNLLTEILNKDVVVAVVVVVFLKNFFCS